MVGRTFVSGLGHYNVVLAAQNGDYMRKAAVPCFAVTTWTAA